ncbi:hypothetical protein ACFL43_02760 [Thermodesulfobacteriota bacterium]
MPERYELEDMLREIEEDEKVMVVKDKKITQEEIQKIIMNKRAQANEKPDGDQES